MEKLLCGIDLGGTKLSVGLVNPGGKILDKIIVYDHSVMNEEAIVEYITLLVRQVISANNLRDSDLEGIGSDFRGTSRYRTVYNNAL
jgi:glucokinase